MRVRVSVKREARKRINFVAVARRSRQPCNHCELLFSPGLPSVVLFLFRLPPAPPRRFDCEASGHFVAWSPPLSDPWRPARLLAASMAAAVCIASVWASLLSAVCER